jgi:hypothetical protein
MRADRRPARAPAADDAIAGVWKYPWGPDGIFVYGGARCYPAGVSPWTSPLCHGIHRSARFFHRTFTKNFRIFSLHADISILPASQCRREPADPILAKLTR